MSFSYKLIDKALIPENEASAADEKALYTEVRYDSGGLTIQESLMQPIVFESSSVQVSIVVTKRQNTCIETERIGAIRSSLFILATLW